MVIWSHLAPGFYATEEQSYGSVSRFGAFGVDIFFAISGLLITKLLLDEKAESGRIGIAAFYLRRAFRILPACFAYLAVVAVGMGLRTRLELLSAVLFFRNYIPQMYGTYSTGHLWSLAVEEQFYLLWPALLVFIVLKRKLTNRVRVVAWIGIACGLWRVADAQNHMTQRLLPFVPVHFRTDLRLDALLWGGVAAFLIGSPVLRQRLEISFRQHTFFGLLAAGLICIARYSLLSSLWLAMLLPLLLISTLLHPHWMISRVLDHAWIRFVGRISYSLYLWQELFLVPGWERRLSFQRFPHNLILTFGCALLSYRFIEKPCMRFGRMLSAQIRTGGLRRAALNAGLNREGKGADGLHLKRSLMCPKKPLCSFFSGWG